MYRLSYERRGDISFIARDLETISYFVTSERSERGTKYDIVTRAIKLILPSLECMRCDIRQNSFIELCYSELHLFYLVVQLCNAYLQSWRISFGIKISFGTKFNSVLNFIRQEISFGKKFHSAWHSETKI